jgi:hypothetical protein
VKEARTKQVRHTRIHLKKQAKVETPKAKQPIPVAIDRLIKEVAAEKPGGDADRLSGYNRVYHRHNR